MTVKLIAKEFRLALHPTSYIFIILSAMLCIPNYPYYVIFFYTGLAIFFTCLSGRENHDVFYSMTLPVSRRDIVAARFSSAVLLQLMQLAAAVPFAFLHASFDMPGNTVGMDANTAFFGFSLLMLGIFNITFFTQYYADVKKVGKAFVIASTVYFIAMLALETLAHVLPFMRDIADTPDPQNMGVKLIILAAGAAAYILLTLTAYKISLKSFIKQDL